MIFLEGVANSKYGTFLTAKMNIAAENLENAEAAHPVSLWRLSWRRKKKRMRRDFGCWMFNF